MTALPQYTRRPVTTPDGMPVIGWSGSRAPVAPRCKCHGLKSQHGTDRRDRPTCFHSGMCGCTEYRPTTDPIADAVQRHPAGKAIPEIPQTADIQDYLRQKGEISRDY